MVIAILEIRFCPKLSVYDSIQYEMEDCTEWIDSGKCIDSICFKCSKSVRFSTTLKTTSTISRFINNRQHSNLNWKLFDK